MKKLCIFLISIAVLFIEGMLLEAEGVEIPVVGVLAAICGLFNMIGSIVDSDNDKIEIIITLIVEMLLLPIATAVIAIVIGIIQAIGFGGTISLGILITVLVAIFSSVTFIFFF